MKKLSRLRNMVVNASERTEFWFVLTLAFGFPIYKSFMHSPTSVRRAISDWSVLSMIAFEIAVLAIVVWIGRIRGWSIQQLGLQPSWRLTAMGILLFFLIFILLAPFILVVHRFVPDSFYHPPTRILSLSLATIFATGIINPLFEETLVCGYIIQRLANKGAVVAITFSAVVRFLCHTYQGPPALVLLATGFLFGYIFWRYRQLWPLIVCHSLVDFIGLAIARSSAS